MLRFAFSFGAILATILVQAQPFFPSKTYPVNTYINPLDIPISLAGNFGECRSNHFHSGIDIRTNKVENLPVHAIQDGFVYRVKIEAGGFGNGLYIMHSDGQMAVYAHLNKFFPELEDYVIRKQYQTQSWKQDMYFMPHQFPVRQGKVIAWSGNTGSSEAPHLHLEIRNGKTEAPLNPLLFYKKLPDTKIPLVKKIAIYNGNKSIYDQSPALYPLSKKGANYQPQSLIKIQSSKAYIGIEGDDYMENALGTLGIYEMHLHVNGKPYFAWQLDNISYDVTRYMNSMADYKTKKNGGPWIQLCHQLPNDKLEIYKSFTPAKGMIDLSDGEMKQIVIDVYDTKGNTSRVEFILQGQKIQTTPTCENAMNPTLANHFKNDYMECKFGDECFYDSICFKTSLKPSLEPYSHLYQIHRPDVPLHRPFELNLKPKAPIPVNLKNKVALQRWPSGKQTKKTGKAVTYIDGRVNTMLREFGQYEIVIDQKVPDIKTSIKNNDNVAKLRRLTFTVKDEITTIKSWHADVDGEWLRVVQKGDVFYYEMDDHFPAGTHTLTFSATDENENTKTVQFNLTR